jgi:8-oxo-dGTP pyrophosphatase MutT (NUDIX family)
METKETNKDKEKILCDKDKAHYIVATCIIVNNGKYLIAKRAPWEKNSPKLWTVPGGKLETKDYMSRAYDTKHGNQWYNVIEDLIKREVMEEVMLEIKNIGYLCSLVYIRHDNIPCLVISLYAQSDEKKVVLQNSLVEFAWVTLKEAKNYDLIDGIYEELEILDNFLKKH